MLIQIIHKVEKFLRRRADSFCQKIRLLFSRFWPKSPYSYNAGLAPVAIIIAIALTVGVATGVGQFILTSLGKKIIEIVSVIILALVTLFGKLLGVVVGILIGVAQYNDFINAPAVSIGWVLIRDICNMFFIVILLVIAFCTVLRIEKYSYKRLLGSLIIAAIIVNFSKLICGLIIDFAQVIMLTFVNAFKDVAVGNFANVLGLHELLSFAGKGGELSEQLMQEFDTFIALVLALIFVIVALVVVTVMMILLIARIVVLWIMIILSPFAFVLSILPQTATYSNQWWSKFTNHVIVGPVMAFFLWLTLSLSKISITQQVENALTEEKGRALVGESAGFIGATISKISQGPVLASFIFGIVMLVYSLVAAQQLGVAGSQMAGRAINRMQQWGQGVAKAPFRLARKGMRAAVVGAGERFHAATGIPVLPSQIKAEWQKAMAERRRERYIKGVGKREQIGTFWAKKGWLKGSRDYLGNILGFGKKLKEDGNSMIKKGQDKKREIEETTISTLDAAKYRQEKKEKEKRLNTLQDELFQFTSSEFADIKLTAPHNKIRMNEVIKFLRDTAAMLKESGRPEDIEKAENLKKEAERLQYAVDSEGTIDLKKYSQTAQNAWSQQINKEINDLEKSINELTKELQKKPINTQDRAQKIAAAEKLIEQGTKMVKRGKEIEEPGGEYYKMLRESVYEAEIKKELGPRELYSSERYLSLAMKTVEDKNFDKFKVIAKIMAQNGDLNDLILQGTRGKVTRDDHAGRLAWAKWVQDTFGTKEQDANRLLYEIGNISMFSGIPRLAYSINYKQVAPGVFEYIPTTEEECKELFKTWAKKIIPDPEKLARTAPRTYMFAEEGIYDKKGNCIGYRPIVDDTFKEWWQDNWEAIATEAPVTGKKRLSLDQLRYYIEDNVFDALKKWQFEIALTPQQQKDYQKLIDGLTAAKKDFKT